MSDSPRPSRTPSSETSTARPPSDQGLEGRSPRGDMGTQATADPSLDMSPLLSAAASTAHPPSDQTFAAQSPLYDAPSGEFSGHVDADNVSNQFDDSGHGSDSDSSPFLRNVMRRGRYGAQMSGVQLVFPRGEPAARAAGREVLEPASPSGGGEQRASFSGDFQNLVVRAEDLEPFDQDFPQREVTAEVSPSLPDETYHETDRKQSKKDKKKKKKKKSRSRSKESDGGNVSGLDGAPVEGSVSKKHKKKKSKKRDRDSDVAGRSQAAFLAHLAQPPRVVPSAYAVRYGQPPPIPPIRPMPDRPPTMSPSRLRELYSSRQQSPATFMPPSRLQSPASIMPRSRLQSPASIMPRSRLQSPASTMPRTGDAPFAFRVRTPSSAIPASSASTKKLTTPPTSKKSSTQKDKKKAALDAVEEIEEDDDAIADDAIADPHAALAQELVVDHALTAEEKFKRFAKVIGLKEIEQNRDLSLNVLHAYPGLRRVDQAHTATLVNELERDFNSAMEAFRSTITFAFVQDGRYYLLDANHRVQALRDFGSSYAGVPDTFLINFIFDRAPATAYQLAVLTRFAEQKNSKLKLAYSFCKLFELCREAAMSFTPSASAKKQNEKDVEFYAYALEAFGQQPLDCIRRSRVISTADMALIRGKFNADKKEKLPRSNRFWQLFFVRYAINPRECMDLFLAFDLVKGKTSELEAAIREVKWDYEVFLKKWRCWNPDEDIDANIDAILPDSIVNEDDFCDDDLDNFIVDGTASRGRKTFFQNAVRRKVPATLDQHRDAMRAEFEKYLDRRRNVREKQEAAQAKKEAAKAKKEAAKSEKSEKKKEKGKKKQAEPRNCLIQPFCPFCPPRNEVKAPLLNHKTRLDQLRTEEARREYALLIWWTYLSSNKTCPSCATLFPFIAPYLSGDDFKTLPVAVDPPREETPSEDSYRDQDDLDDEAREQEEMDDEARDEDGAYEDEDIDHEEELDQEENINNDDGVLSESSMDAGALSSSSSHDGNDGESKKTRKRKAGGQEKVAAKRKKPDVPDEDD